MATVNVTLGIQALAGPQLSITRPMEVQAYDRVAGQIVDLWVIGLPMTALQAETDELNKVALSAANGVAAKYAAPAGTSILLVGDLSKIEQGIRELNLGDVVILDVEGKPVAAGKPAGNK